MLWDGLIRFPGYLLQRLLRFSPKFIAGHRQFDLMAKRWSFFFVFLPRDRLFLVIRIFLTSCKIYIAGLQLQRYAGKDTDLKMTTIYFFRGLSFFLFRANPSPPSLMDPGQIQDGGFFLGCFVICRSYHGKPFFFGTLLGEKERNGLL